MAERHRWEPEAGPWVAYRDTPKRKYNPEIKQYEDVPGETQRSYLHSSLSLTTTKEDGLRYDTKAEAIATARKRYPRRVQGCRIGAERA